jgi:PKD repeat protein
VHELTFAWFLAATALSPLSTATGPAPIITFSTPGTKTVTLKACNAAGCSTVSKSLTVLDPAPRIVSETVPATVGTSSPPVTFAATAAGRPPLSYNWTLALADGSSRTATGPSFTWAPQVVGTHQVTLAVSNLSGVRTATRPFSVAPNVFSDVPPDFWAADAIEALYFAGVTTGCGLDAAGQRVFCPGNTLTRAEIAVFLGRGRHPVPYTPPPATGVFADVPRTFWAADWIELAFHEGLTTGCSLSGSLRFFCPAGTATRAETAVLLERALHPASFVPPPPIGIFVDVPVTYWVAAWIEQLYRDGITAGCAANGPLRFFCPDPTLTRAEMAVFLARGFHLGQAPQPLTFLARLCSAGSCSYPAGMPIDFNLQLRGGIPTAYDYDWNGDGVYEETVAFPVSHTFSAPGVFTPKVRLRRGTSVAVLAHPYPITVRAASFGSPSPPTSLVITTDALVPPGATDPPGTPARVGYRVSMPLQIGVLGYALFVNPGTVYQFAGLIQANRVNAPDELLLAPGAPGVVRYLYVRAFSATGYGPSSLPVRIP